MTTADVADSAHMSALVARQLDAAADAVEGLTKRVFYPTVETRYFEWPQDQFAPTRRLYLGKHEVVAVPSDVVTGIGNPGKTIDPTFVTVTPTEDGPPYSAVVLDDHSPHVFEQGTTREKSIGITSTYGYRIDETTVATTASTLAGSLVTVSSAAQIGTGTLLRVGTERLIVIARSWVDTGNLEPVTLAKDKADTTVTVTTGTGYEAGEELLIDAERVLILAVTGNTLLVRRAVGGSPLAAHTDVFTLWAQRQLTVARGQLGTTILDQAATGVVVRKFLYPGLVTQLFVAEAVVGLQQSRAGWARMAGTGDHAMETVGRGLKDLRCQVQQRFRRLRLEAV